TVLLGGIALGGAWILGRTVRDRRTQTARAVRESARRAATEERLNLARELHDVVSGTLNVIHVQASVARHLARERPEQAVETLRTIESASREGIAEMGRMLDILRNGDGSGDETRGRVPDDAPHDVPDGARHLPDGARHLPQRDTETLPNHLERIADAARAAGVDVSLVSEGLDGPGGAGAEVALTVRRVVREGLTNVVRHAAPTRCRIRVVADRGRVEVEIVDEGRVHGSGAETGRGASGDVPGAPDVSGARDGLDGRDGPGGRGLPGVPQPPETSGHGLPGMRERVTALGGGLTAGPVPGGGFRVRATVPRRRWRPPPRPTDGGSTKCWAPRCAPAP
ncbi:histidine kinase, partial [Streptomyces sp. NPDC048845]|uniref:sensor histidine kinase n=1 Tax=Streptomyces sp. NPDC048845 TaxID=3155390 RepID=UPI00343AD33C